MTEIAAAAPAGRDPARSGVPGFTGTDALLGLMVLLWGVNYSVIKAAMREITPLAFNAGRFLLASSALALIAWASQVPRPARPDILKLASAWTMGLGAVPPLLYSTPAVLAQPWREVSALAFGGLLFSAIAALVVSYLTWFRGVQLLGPSRTAFYSNLTPSLWC